MRNKAANKTLTREVVIMKIMIEVSGGVVTNIVSTGEVSIYLIDHDNIKERGDDLTNARQAFQPDYITGEGGHIATPNGSEFPEFDAALESALEDYAEGDTGLFCGVIPEVRT